MMLKALVLALIAAVIAHGWGGAPSPPVIAEEFRTEMVIVRCGVVRWMGREEVQSM